jgi:hypothetical protein
MPGSASASTYKGVAATSPPHRHFHLHRRLPPLHFYSRCSICFLLLYWRWVAALSIRLPISLQMRRTSLKVVKRGRISAGPEVHLHRRVKMHTVRGDTPLSSVVILISFFVTVNSLEDFCVWVCHFNPTYQHPHSSLPLPPCRPPHRTPQTNTAPQ